jgi:hypothetical protein
MRRSESSSTEREFSVKNPDQRSGLLLLLPFLLKKKRKKRKKARINSPCSKLQGITSARDTRR